MTITIDDGELGEMEALILNEKYHREQLEKAQVLIERWTPRVKLAEERGRIELAGQAREMLRNAKQDYALARQNLERIAMEKSMLRQEARRPDDRTHAEIRDEQALDAFRSMGADPETYELNQVAKEQTADDALAALKARMKE